LESEVSGCPSLSRWAPQKAPMREAVSILPHRNKVPTHRVSVFTMIPIVSLVVLFLQVGIYGADTAWNFASGRWARTGQVLTQSDPLGVSLALTQAVRQRYSAQVRVRFLPRETSAAVGLVLQASDTADYDVFELEKKAGGLYAVLKTVRNTKITYLSNEMV